VIRRRLGGSVSAQSTSQAEARDQKAGHVAAALGGCQEDDALGEGQRRHEQGAAQDGARLVGDPERLERRLARVVPEPGPAVDHHQLRQQPALAVPDQDHAAKRRVGPLRIQLGYGLRERFTEEARRVQLDRVRDVPGSCLLLRRETDLASPLDVMCSWASAYLRADIFPAALCRE